MKDDRISSKEAPVVSPSFVDIYGTAWESRPDNVIRREVNKIGLSEDDYFLVENFIALRKWDELLEHLSQRERRAPTGDDKRRIESAREAVADLIQKQRNDI